MNYGCFCPLVSAPSKKSDTDPTHTLWNAKVIRRFYDDFDYSLCSVGVKKFNLASTFTLSYKTRRCEDRAEGGTPTSYVFSLDILDCTRPSVDT